MKKMFFAVALVLSSFSLMANKTDVEKKVNFRFTQSLNQQFDEVYDLQWTSTSGEMMRANFTNGENKKVSAFFNGEGEFVASTTNLKFSELPKKLQTRLQEKMIGLTPVEVVEMESTTEHAYFIKAIVDGKEKLIKGDSYGFFKEVPMPRI